MELQSSAKWTVRHEGFRGAVRANAQRSRSSQPEALSGYILTRRHLPSECGLLHPLRNTTLRESIPGVVPQPDALSYLASIMQYRYKTCSSWPRMTLFFHPTYTKIKAQQANSE